MFLNGLKNLSRKALRRPRPLGTPLSRGRAVRPFHPALETLESRVVLSANLVVFGDSLSDVGNLSLSDGNIETPSPPYYEGRFSNGPVWVETLASYLGAAPLQPSYVGGTDYAWGGATVAFSQGGYPPSIPEQVNQYLGNLQTANQTIAANDVFAVWAGTNDYLDTFLDNNGPTTPIDPAASASALTDALQTLVTAGAKTIVVNNLGLLGDIPYIRATDAFYQQGGALIASANAWTTAYNSDLAADLSPLAGALVVQVDVAGLEGRVFQNPTQYGFTNTTGGVGPFDAPYGGLITTVTVPDPQDYFFLDGVHPTTKAQQLIGVTAADDLPAGVKQVWNNFNGNAQHTGISTVAAQPTDRILWQTSVNLQGSYFWHTGEPVFTPNNTVIVPVKVTSSGQQTGTANYELEAFNGNTGTLMWTVTSQYIAVSNGWLPPYQPVYDPVTNRVYFPGLGGTLEYISNPDNPGSSTPTPTVEAFYGTYTSAYNSSISIDTPLTVDNAGTVYFGFTETGSNPSGISDGGIGRVSAAGAGSYVTATVATGAGSGAPAVGSAPALSNDGSILYAAIVDSAGSYLVGVNAASLAHEDSVALSVPNSNTGVYLNGYSTAAPMVAPDGTVYQGVFANAYDGSRGFMTHYSANLATEYTPGAFGWDDTASIIPVSMVPSYRGTSTYLILTKYNNYVAAETGSSGGNGVNEIAVLDPNATQQDPNNDPNPNLLVMKQVLTITSPTEDSDYVNGGYPDATREWCTNGTVVDPSSDSVFINNEDGYSYRWNLATNTISQAVEITNGYGEPYTPTAIGPNGVVYAINGGTLFALGGYSNYTLTNVSSLTPAPAGQAVTFTTTVASTNGGAVPAGSIIYSYTSGVNNPLNSTPVTLATVPLVNGQATFTTSALVPNHYHIIASYSGDMADGYAAGSTTLVQVLLGNPATTLSTSASPILAGQSVTFTATVNPGSVFFVPLGTVAFMNGSTLLGTVALNPLDQSTSPSSSQTATFTTSSLPAGTDSITAVYSGDLNFAASTSAPLTEAVNQAPAITSAAGTTFTVGSAGSFQVTASGSPANITYSESGTLPLGVTFTSAGLLSGTPTVFGSFPIVVTASNGIAPSATQSFTLTVNQTANFYVFAPTLTSNGVLLDFGQTPDPTKVHLYSGPGSGAIPGSAALTLTGPNGPVRGSLLFDATYPNLVSFIATNGPLAAGSYTLVLKSSSGLTGGATAWQSLAGQPLGSSGGTSGDYTTTFTVGSNTAAIVSLPSFARGAGQTVSVPNTASGIPISIASASGVTQVSFTLTYDPRLLTIAATGALTPTAAASSAGLTTIAYSISSVDLDHSVLSASLSGGSGLSAGSSPVALVDIAASVPNGAPYLDKAVLNLGSVLVNNAAAPGVSGVDEAAYLGDVSGDQSISGVDASLVAQVAAGVGSGFSAYKDLDPAIIGNVSGSGSLGGLDASKIAQFAASLSVPQIPLIPGGNATVTAASWSGGMVSITTAAAPALGYAVGQTVLVSGMSPSGYNGTFLITAVASGTTFSYAVAANPGTATGYGTATVSAPTGADPLLYIGAAGDHTALTLGASQATTAQVRVEVTDAGGITMAAADLGIVFDPRKFQISNVTVCSALAGFHLTMDVDNTQGFARLVLFGSSELRLAAGFDGDLVDFTLTATSNFRAGQSGILKLARSLTDNHSTIATDLANDKGSLTLKPAPTQDFIFGAGTNPPVKALPRVDATVRAAAKTPRALGNVSRPAVAWVTGLSAAILQRFGDTLNLLPPSTRTPVQMANAVAHAMATALVAPTLSDAKLDQAAVKKLASLVEESVVPTRHDRALLALLQEDLEDTGLAYCQSINVG